MAKTTLLVSPPSEKDILKHVQALWRVVQEQQRKIAVLEAAAPAADSAVMHLARTETVSGQKTFSATITGSITGNAGSATRLATPRAINGVSFDGTAAITIPSNIAAGTSGNLMISNGTIWTSAAVPTWNQNTSGSSASCTGNAGTATKLAASVTINGVSFDGSGNVSVPSDIAAGTLGNLMISNGTIWTSAANPCILVSQATPQTLGSDANRLAKLWATDITVTNAITGSVTGSSGSCTGNAGTATKLAASVTINGVSFDGSGNVSVPSDIAPGGLGNVMTSDGSKWIAGPPPPGTGTVTSVSVVTANGVSGSVATQTTTPAITLTLGNITPASVAAVGTVTGSNLTGNNTGDQDDVTGNAGTATALATARTINGVSFDGTANIILSPVVTDTETARMDNGILCGYASLGTGEHTGDGTGGGSYLDIGGLGSFFCTKAKTALQGAMGTIFGGCKGSAVANVSNGFTFQDSGMLNLGPNTSVNSNGVPYWDFWIKAHSGNLAKMSAIDFTYNGNGVARTLTGLGKDLSATSNVVVIIKGAGTQAAVFRTNKHIGSANSSYFLNNTADLATAITGLTSDGFSIGTSATVNTNGVVYNGVVLVEDSSGTAEICTGTFIGDVSPVTVYLPFSTTSDSMRHLSCFFIPNGANSVMFTAANYLQYVSAATAAPGDRLSFLNRMLTIPANTEINVVDVKVNFCAITSSGTVGLS